MSVLSGDFDAKITKEQCLENVVKNAGKGSIVVLHDSLKAWEKLEYALPRLLRFYADRGFRFDALSERAMAEKSLAHVA